MCSYSPHSSAHGRSNHISQLWRSHFHSACIQNHIDIPHNRPTGRGYRIEYHRTPGTHWRIYCSESFQGMRALWEGIFKKKKGRGGVFIYCTKSNYSYINMATSVYRACQSSTEACVQTRTIYLHALAHCKRLMYTCIISLECRD